MSTLTIERAWGMDKHGMDKQVGWDIFQDGNWGNRYALLRDAKAALAVVQREERRAETAAKLVAAKKAMR